MLAQAVAGARAIVGRRKFARPAKGLRSRAKRSAHSSAPSSDAIRSCRISISALARPWIGVTVDGVARQRPIIGLVVADDESASACRARRSGLAKRSSASHRMPTCQGRGQPRQTGVKL